MVVQHQNTINQKQIVALYEKMREYGDFIHADRIIDVLEKYQNQELIIALVGHFSAGKSSMINHLMGSELLANSPIPTSANIVKITSGQGVANVYFHNGDKKVYTEPYDLQEIKQYSTDKRQISRIDISTSTAILPEGTAILDTPGIDAADDADRMLTESALHLADYMLYITDYNHVQSEVNLQFLQTMEEKQLPYVVIVNQIDKHDDEELTFDEFQQKIKQTFDQWNLHPSKVFYTSLKEPQANYNQWDELSAFVYQMLRNKKDYLHTSTSMMHILEDHKSFVHNNTEKKLDLFATDTEWSEKEEKWNDLSARIQLLTQQGENLKESFTRELQQTLKNAYLMPAELREKAKAYLESQQAGFKIGGIFKSQKKTEEAKQEREQQFLDGINETTQTVLKWKIRDKWYEEINKQQLPSSLREQILPYLKLQLDKRDLAKAIRKGAEVNGDFVLLYTNDLAEQVKGQFRRQMRSMLDEVSKQLEQLNAQEISSVNMELNHLNQLKETAENKELIIQEKKEYLRLLEETLVDPKPSNESLEEMQHQIHFRKPNGSYNEEDTAEQQTEMMSEVQKIDDHVEENSTQLSKVSTRALQKSMIEASSILDLSGFESFQNDLNKREYSLKNRSYTIALFGAFSAGKSSFANALIGEEVLPVSPNPTTAAVNRIRPVQEPYEHGQVVVSVKSETAMIQDVQRITKAYRPPEGTLEELIKWVDKKAITKDENLQRMYRSYLAAIENGYQQMKDYLGSEMIITLQEFSSFVTEESKACFIKEMDLYYDCGITQQGITLVDTPGADSINARHTNVSFEYIKHADAILYVTYYNHALSRADKDFLMQLGRVKDVFELDKMFFIVNASDLAVDQTELALVTNYVEEQLIQLGIRHPRLYPVSSKQSLREKRAKEPLNDEMMKLEESFYSFIHNDLTSLTKQAAVRDLERAYHALMEYIRSLQMDESGKEQRKKEINDARNEAIQFVSTFNDNSYITRLQQKLEKQTFYVAQRFGIRFHDLFKEIYNPTTITESGSAGRDQLYRQFEELIIYINQELKQELQAIALRMEHLIHDCMKEIHEEITSFTFHRDGIFELSSIELPELRTPEKYPTISIEKDASLKKVISNYKDTRSFFVKNQKETIKDQFYAIIEPYVKAYVDEGNTILYKDYEEQWTAKFNQLKSQWQAEVEEIAEQYINRMFVSVDIEMILERSKQLEKLLHDIKGKD
ncbi:dynamin family protein [Oceanobacillus sp. 1P07AA]|uniref:dynamin family protein n=1 Tax=Oceanobacillus sp. 1P07AA TaxID=3132293 RepID=UPI0039A4186B